MEKYIILFEERSESLKNILEITKNLDNNLIYFKNHKKYNSNIYLDNDSNNIYIII